MEGRGGSRDERRDEKGRGSGSVQPYAKSIDDWTLVGGGEAGI